MNWDYEGDFLKAWPIGCRSLIANQFCYAVRDGAQTVDDVLIWVRGDARRRIANSSSDETQEILLFQSSTLEARRFAEHILAREQLSWEEKEALKAEVGRDFARAHMAEQEPTLKQLAYLKYLGCQMTPKTKLEAHDLIDKFKSGNVQRPEQSAHRA